jgi:hypothetical protein
MFHVKHRPEKAETMRFCKTTLWIKKSPLFFKDITVTSFGTFGEAADRSEAISAGTGRKIALSRADRPRPGSRACRGGMPCAAKAAAATQNGGLMYRAVPVACFALGLIAPAARADAAAARPRRTAGWTGRFLADPQDSPSPTGPHPE